MRDAFAHCEALLRAADRDRFLATLFAPAEHRAALFALYVFNVEITRVREAAREPLAGEIRLQWWSDVLGGGGGGGGARGLPGGGRAAREQGALPPSGGAFRGADRGAPVRSLRRADGDARRSRGLCGRRVVRSDRAGGAGSPCRRRAGDRRA